MCKHSQDEHEVLVERQKRLDARGNDRRATKRESDWAVGLMQNLNPELTRQLATHVQAMADQEPLFPDPQYSTALETLGDELNGLNGDDPPDPMALTQVIMNGAFKMVSDKRGNQLKSRDNVLRDYYKAARAKGPFAYQERGRLVIPASRRRGSDLDRSGGIVSSVERTESLENVFAADVKHAKGQLGMDPAADTVHKFRDQGAPYIGGASGTMCLIAVDLENEKPQAALSPDELKEREKLLALHMASLVVGGHHSMAEVLIGAKCCGYFKDIPDPIEENYDKAMAVFEDHLNKLGIIAPSPLSRFAEDQGKSPEELAYDLRRTEVQALWEEYEHALSDDLDGLVAMQLQRAADQGPIDGKWDAAMATLNLLADHIEEQGQRYISGLDKNWRLLSGDELVEKFGRAPKSDAKKSLRYKAVRDQLDALQKTFKKVSERTLGDSQADAGVLEISACLKNVQAAAQAYIDKHSKPDEKKTEKAVLNELLGVCTTELNLLKGILSNADFASQLDTLTIRRALEFQRKSVNPEIYGEPSSERIAATLDELSEVNASSELDADALVRRILGEMETLQTEAGAFIQLNDDIPGMDRAVRDMQLVQQRAEVDIAALEKLLNQLDTFNGMDPPFDLRQALEIARFGIDPSVLMPNHNSMNPATEQSREVLGSGAVNTVYRVTWLGDEEGDEEIVRVFKEEPETENKFAMRELGIDTNKPDFGKRNVATRKAAESLGLDHLVPAVDMVISGGKLGVAMELAAGQSAWKQMEVPIPADRADRIGSYNWERWGVRQLPDGSFVQKKAVKVPLDIENDPEIDRAFQKQCVQLQWLDGLCGQTDRHAENYLVDIDRDNHTVKITGIDNDFCFGKQQVGVERVIREDQGQDQESPLQGRGKQNCGLPQLIDQELYERLTTMSFADFSAGMDALLLPEEIAAAESRFNEMVAYARDLADRGLVVGDWETFRYNPHPDAEDADESQFLTAKEILMNAEVLKQYDQPGGAGNYYLRDIKIDRSARDQEEAILRALSAADDVSEIDEEQEQEVLNDILQSVVSPVDDEVAEAEFSIPAASMNLSDLSAHYGDQLRRVAAQGTFSPEYALFINNPDTAFRILMAGGLDANEAASLKQDLARASARIPQAQDEHPAPDVQEAVFDAVDIAHGRNLWAMLRLFQDHGLQ